VIALVFGRKKKGSKVGTFLVLVLVTVSVSMTLSACGGGEPQPTPPPPDPNQNPTQTSSPAPTQTQIPSPTAPVSPTESPTSTPCPPTATLTIGDQYEHGGNEVIALYNKMKNYPNGWWHNNDKVHNFDITVFFGLMLYHEGQGNLYGGILGNLSAIAISQQLYVGSWRPAYCSIGQCSDNAVANNWADYSQSIHGLLNEYIIQNKDISLYSGYGGHGTADPIGVLERAWELGNMMIYPKSLDSRKDDALSIYGNDPGWVEKLSDENVKPYTVNMDGNPRSVYYYLPKNDGAGVYASVNQANCWKDKICYHISSAP
jgi:hypothetical protein